MNVRKRSTRFKSDPTESATVVFSSDKKRRKFPALLVNESFTGANLVLTAEIQAEVGDKIMIELKTLPLQAKIVWVKLWEAGIWRCGIQFDSEQSPSM